MKEILNQHIFDALPAGIWQRPSEIHRRIAQKIGWGNPFRYGQIYYRMKCLCRCGILRRSMDGEYARIDGW